MRRSKHARKADRGQFFPTSTDILRSVSFPRDIQHLKNYSTACNQNSSSDVDHISWQNKV